MEGYKLQYGIWNFKHSITSRDVGRPEVHRTMDKINEVLREKNRYYNSIGYELWFQKVTDIDVYVCKCGKYCETGEPCWYCGNEV